MNLSSRLRYWFYLLILVMFYFLLFLGSVCAVKAQEKFDPSLAVVRIKSHGASGTVIWSRQGKSYILSCAHMFDTPASLKRPLRIDGPVQPKAPRVLVKPKVLAVDFTLDLSLIELPNGPFYTVPVAPAGYQPGTQLLSIGYDNMSWPVTRRIATFLNTGPTTTYTRERPWHGRSGGGLIDPKRHYLVGVVQGYEVTGSRRGLYVSHAAILRFLKNRPGILQRPVPVAPAVPYAFRQPRSFAFPDKSLYFPGGS